MFALSPSLGHFSLFSLFGGVGVIDQTLESIGELVCGGTSAGVDDNTDKAKKKSTQYNVYATAHEQFNMDYVIRYHFRRLFI